MDSHLIDEKLNIEILMIKKWFLPSLSDLSEKLLKSPQMTN